MNQSSHQKGEIQPKSLSVKGKTFPQILPFIPMFQNALENEPVIIQTTITPIIDFDKNEQELALTIYTEEPISKEQIDSILNMLPKDIPADIPIKFDVINSSLVNFQSIIVHKN